MPALRCTVRECALPLFQEGESLRCASGHAFDRARRGYWNLLQPQDRRSLRAGDRDEALVARRRWLARGFADGLVDALVATIEGLSLRDRGVAVDLGCGDGTLTTRILGSGRFDACGVDLATAGIRLASKMAPQITWIVANADRGLPFADASVDLVLSIFGRRPATEMNRILTPHGALIAVVPGEDDMIELREAAQGRSVRRDRLGEALSELGPAFDLAVRSTWRHRARHDRGALEDALAMSYRGARARERQRLGTLSELGVTLCAEILALVPRGGVR